MSDPIARAFAHVPCPEPAIDFDRHVVARLEPLRAARMRAARATMAGYWLGAVAASAIGVGTVPSMPLAQAVGGSAAVLAVIVCSLAAAGGVKNFARALRSTLP